MAEKENPVYTVIPSGNYLRCIDTSNGMTAALVNMGGEIITGPIVTGDRCVVVYKSGSGKKGRILKLPKLSTITIFNP